MDDKQIRHYMQRINLQPNDYEPRWKRTPNQCLKPRAKSEYSYLDKLHVDTWTEDEHPSECRDSGVSLPLAISQASNLQYDVGQNEIDRSFGFLDEELYNPPMNGLRPHIFNCRSEPSIPPRLAMEPLSQVRPGYQDARPASIHISSNYHDNVEYLMPYQRHVHQSMDSVYNLTPNSVDHLTDPIPFTPEEQHVVIDKDPKKGFGFTIRTATNLKTRDRVKIKEVKPDGPAAMNGLMEGQVLLHVNGKDIQQLTFEDIVHLIDKNDNTVKLTVVNSSSPLAPPDDVLHEGYLSRQIKCGGIKIWCKHWVVIRRDGFLYYYRSRESQDPSGVIVLSSYRCSKTVVANKKYVIKLIRGLSTYLFAAQDNDDYERWLSVLMEANQTKGFSLSISMNNCALAALAIDNPLVSGYLYKLKFSGFRAKRKYCVMKDTVLLLYHDINDKKAHEVISLARYTCAPTSVRNWKYCFALIPPSMKRCNNVLVYACESKILYDKWLKELKYVLDNQDGAVAGDSSNHANSKDGTSDSTSSPTTSPLPQHPSYAHFHHHPPLPSPSPSTPRRKDSNELNREYYRPKLRYEVKNSSVCNVNTLVHTESDARPRSWHLD